MAVARAMQSLPRVPRFSANTRLTKADLTIVGVSDTSDTGGEKVRSLKEAIRKVRTAEAERSDVVVELRDAERARLELLAEELRSVFSEVPPEDEQFLFTVAAGTPPRLWIDMTAFVVLGRDRRTYRFLKDTRLGRTVILETAKVDEVADTITEYVAERIIERERAIEGDWMLKRVMREDLNRGRSHRDARAEREARAAALPAAAGLQPGQGATAPAGQFVIDSRTLGWVVAAFLAGILIGVMVLFGYAWVSVA
jgi:hypothetical protein